jgi:hypothetical protein
MINLNFNIDEIKTFEDVRDALQSVREAFQSTVLNKGEWKFFEITLESAVSEFTYSHKLSFIPKDVIQVSVTNSAEITWHYDEFDRTNLVISSSAACTVRAYIGRHREGA